MPDEPTKMTNEEYAKALDEIADGFPGSLSYYVLPAALVRQAEHVLNNNTGRTLNRRMRTQHIIIVRKP